MKTVFFALLLFFCGVSQAQILGAYSQDSLLKINKVKKRILTYRQFKSEDSGLWSFLANSREFYSAEGLLTKMESNYQDSKFPMYHSTYFYYDSSKKLYAMEKKSGHTYAGSLGGDSSVLLTNITMYIYNGEGKLLRSYMNYVSGKVYSEMLVTYEPLVRTYNWYSKDEVKNIQVINYYDGHNNIIRTVSSRLDSAGGLVSNKIHSMENKYNDKGQLTEVMKDGDPESVVTFSYYENGLFKSSKGSIFYPAGKARYKYYK